MKERELPKKGPGNFPIGCKAKHFLDIFKADVVRTYVSAGQCSEARPIGYCIQLKVGSKSIHFLESRQIGMGCLKAAVFRVD
jgi:hypothetical protein